MTQNKQVKKEKMWEKNSTKDLDDEDGKKKK